MHRFYLAPSEWTETPYLVGDEAKHLAQVLRLQVGASIIVFDGNGNFAEARILSVSKQRVDLMLEIAEYREPPRPEITLVQAIPKGKNMDWIVQKAVELGVSKIQPIITRHTIVSPGEDKAEKWRRTALEACKQCSQFTLPIIADPLPFTEWLHKRESCDLELIASLAEDPKNFRDTLQLHPEAESVSIAIGPEGDFSDDETNAALAAGLIPVTLGDLVLRVETATMFSLSVIRSYYS